VAPGSASLTQRAESVPIAVDDLDALVAHATAEAYDLVVIGPEAPLVAGLADRLRRQGIAVFGPDAAAARLEGSKAFAKEFMGRHGIPTASFRVFDAAGAAAARDFLQSERATYPLVIKADGLAAGKGVVLCEDAREAVGTARAMLEERAFGEAGARIVVEERLLGREASYFVLCDGTRFVPLATCQDYKRAEDGDRGQNTGGMGSYSPSAYVDPLLERRILRSIVAPTVEGLLADGLPYRGLLYVGLMLTDDGPQVLEYNVRFGDPETQALVPRLDGDWLELLHASATGRLEGQAPRWKKGAAVCVVLAAHGYPGAYEKGRLISGLAEAGAGEGVLVFHAGSVRRGEAWLTAGGRVLGVTALADDLAAARERAYTAVSRIHWEGQHHRSDIAQDAVTRLLQKETS
jgi:phosphoribosylamine--glycine ligase